ncbi:MAG: site-specific DNA-methyltransferase [Prevotella sp.]|nr:site-specific DNA-methyltransferase [Prevotella sp.]
MEKLNMQTTNIVDENIKRIGELFPNCLTERLNDEGKPEVAIDFDQLRQELSKDIVEGPEERYQFTWPDKRNVIRLANVSTTDTLRPCREESVDFDKTKNLYIEGDNLQLLKLLRENYLGKVKLIYIDPPYNTGNDFVYNDDFSQTVGEYIHNSGQEDEEGNRLIANVESNGRFHTDWLNMIYPRLKVAKDLLSEDGVIFISIDHHELVNLTGICDEIFGMNNRVGIISTINNLKGRSDDAFFATCNEFLLVYARSKRSLSIKGFSLDDEELDDDYDLQDEIGYYKLIGYRKTGNAWKREERPYMFYPVLLKDGEFSTVLQEELDKIYDARTLTFDDEFVDKLTETYTSLGYKVYWPLSEKGEKGRWRWGISTFYEQKDINLGVNNAGTLCTKMRATLEDGSIRMKSAKTLWYKPEYDTGSSAKLLTSLFGKADLFQNPKSIVYMKDILTIATEKDSLVLDFFSGSCTTAHAVMQLNAEDKGCRRFIMVQFPEKTSSKSEAYKAGYKTICEIGKERIRRAGKKIKEESPLTTQDLDTGFRVLKLDSSNMQDVYYTPADFNERDLFEDNIKPDRTEEDLLFQAMIELGIELSAKIEKKEIAGKTVWNVSDGYLLACFDEDVNETTITEIAKQHPYYFVMRDKSLANDNVADNFEQIFEHYSKDTIRRII